MEIRSIKQCDRLLGNDDSEDENQLNLDKQEKINKLINTPLELRIKKNDVEKKIRGPYMIGATKKSTWYDKYGPNGSFTKAAANTLQLEKWIGSSTSKEISLDNDNVETVELMRILCNKS